MHVINGREFDYIVAADGGGDFESLQEALDTIREASRIFVTGEHLLTHPGLIDGHMITGPASVIDGRVYYPSRDRSLVVETS